jgi:hypothetical protein
MVSLTLFAEGKYDWLINHNWFLETNLFDLNKPYRVIFRKLEVSPGITMYQERLRNERFTLEYQTDKLFQLEDTLSNNIYDLEFGNNYNLLLMKWGNIPYPTRQQRVGKQVNKNYPLVGIWGSLPNLTEYRIVDSKDCFIYMEIADQFPYLAIREGTYLLKQINENTFETVSSFPDGRLRLTVRAERQIILSPLFTLPDNEQGSVEPLFIIRFP